MDANITLDEMGNSYIVVKIHNGNKEISCLFKKTQSTERFYLWETRIFENPEQTTRDNEFSEAMQQVFGKE